MPRTSVYLSDDHLAWLTYQVEQSEEQYGPGAAKNRSRIIREIIGYYRKTHPEREIPQTAQEDAT